MGGDGVRQIHVALIVVLLAPPELKANDVSLDKWHRADRETERLNPNRFPELPVSVARELERRVPSL